MDRAPASAFMDSLRDLLRPIEGRPALLDEELAPLLGTSVPSLRRSITRNLPQVPEGEIFRTAEQKGRYALTELGALLMTSWISTPEPVAISLGIIRTVRLESIGALGFFS